MFNHSLARNRRTLAGRIADLDEVLRLNPKHIEARFDRAVVRRRSGDESGAVEDYTRCWRWLRSTTGRTTTAPSCTSRTGHTQALRRFRDDGAAP
ncbi:MAG: tetratricopeptide repeat protein [Anaerolineae bacterium]